jgi:hypothetical protein
MGGACRMHGIDEKYVKNFCRKNERKNKSVDLWIYGRIILEWILEEQVGKVLTTSIWSRIGTSGGLL